MARDRRGTNTVEASDYVGFDPTTRTYHARHDWEGPDSLVFTVVRTVAVATGTAPTDLDPLHHVVPTDALEAIVGDRSRSPVELSFEYHAREVTVDSDGTVVVGEARP